MPARRIANFTESVIREMTRLAVRHNAVNLAQGFPDFPAPEEIKEAACRAIREDINQYAITWGSAVLRQAIAEKYRRHYGLEIDPETEVTVVCGSTEGMVASLLALADPEDEIVMFEPFYENYGPDADLCSARRVYVRLQSPDWRFDPDELRAVFSNKTRAIILNSPHNPTGKVFTREELKLIADLCLEYGALCLTDEIYEHIIYDGRRHIPMMSLDGMRNSTVLVNSMSKTYSVTGWRVGWVIAAPELTAAIRKVHDFLTVGAAAPLQAAGAAALASPDECYRSLAAHYQEKRDYLVQSLRSAGFTCGQPEGAYYVMCGAGRFGFSDDLLLARHMIEKIGLAAVPASSFFRPRHSPETTIRFCFCKKYETLQAAGQLLQKMSSTTGG